MHERYKLRQTDRQTHDDIAKNLDRSDLSSILSQFTRFTERQTDSFLINSPRPEKPEARFSKNLRTNLGKT